MSELSLPPAVRGSRLVGGVPFNVHRNVWGVARLGLGMSCPGIVWGVKFVPSRVCRGSLPPWKVPNQRKRWGRQTCQRSAHLFTVPGMGGRTAAAMSATCPSGEWRVTCHVPP